MYSTTTAQQHQLAPTTKVCQGCGDEFTPAYNTTQRQKYCSDECRYAAKQKRQHYERFQYICQQCGQPYKTAYKERNQFCSRECAFAHKAGKPKLPNQKPLLDCKQCGGAFDQKKTELFCSDECRKIYKASKAREREERNYRPPALRCKECGRDFEPGYGNKRRGFCGVRCANKWANRQSGGTLNQRARKALRKFYNKLTSDVYQVIKAAKVYQRDKWQCKICGHPIDKEAEPREPLSASIDHIIPLSRGGIHTYDNVQAAHFECNWRKGAA